MQLVRSCLPRPVWVGGKRYLIDPPTVRIANEVLSFVKGTLQNDMHSRGMLLDTLSRWLPVPLYRVLANEKRTTSFLLVTCCLLWVSENARELKPEDKQQTETIHKAAAVASQMDYGKLVADYAYFYNKEPFSVYNEVPFGSFLYFLDQLPRLTATEVVDRLAIESIGKIQDDLERKAAQKELQKRLGIYKELTRDERIAQGKKNMEKLATLLGGKQNAHS